MRLLDLDLDQGGSILVEGEETPRKEIDVEFGAEASFRILLERGRREEA
jgi:hypothetical protein